MGWSGLGGPHMQAAIHAQAGMRIDTQTYLQHSTAQHALHSLAHTHARRRPPPWLQFLLVARPASLPRRRQPPRRQQPHRHPRHPRRPRHSPPQLDPSLARPAVRLLSSIVNAGLGAAPSRLPASPPHPLLDRAHGQPPCHRGPLHSRQAPLAPSRRRRRYT